jgi:CRP-like cAMP-binding protein
MRTKRAGAKHPPNHLLASLPAAEYRRLKAVLEPVELTVDRMLFSPGRPMRHVYFPGHGLCSIVRRTREGRTVEVASVGAEGLVGIDALFGTTAGSWQPVVTVPDTAALAMSTQAFHGEMERHSAFARSIRSYARAFMNALAQSVACNARHSAEQRCARWLLTLRDQLGHDELPFTQAAMARALGLRRPTVTLIVGRFRKSRLIDYGAGRLAIMNRTALKSKSCECYGLLRHYPLRRRR